MENNNPRNKVSDLQKTITDLNVVIFDQQVEITRLVNDSSQNVNPMRKYSKCCNAILFPYISDGKKQCLQCKTYYPWELDHGQKSVF